MVELSDFIKSQITVSNDELTTILSYFKERSILRGKLLIRQGQLVDSYYFVKSGALRIYLNRNGKEITAWLAFQNDFFTELTSLKTGQPTMVSIEAIETAELLTIQKAHMDLLFQQFPVWQQFGRQLWEDAFLKVVNGILNYQTMTAEERYLQLMTQSDALQRVPLKQLASYLGITQTSLSRLRKNIK